MWWIRHKPNSNVLIINKRTGTSDLLGERVLGYTSLRSARQALAVNGVYMDRLDEFELVNELGKTMEEMITWPVKEGYALRHSEGGFVMVRGKADGTVEIMDMWLM